MLETVKAVRQEFERKEVDVVLLKELYREYTHIPDIDKFLQQARELFPHLNCGLASLYLKHKLKEGKVVTGMYGSHNHTYLQLESGDIIDITADQYGGPTVYAGPIISPWKKSF